MVHEPGQSDTAHGPSCRSQLSSYPGMTFFQVADKVLEISTQCST